MTTKTWSALAIILLFAIIYWRVIDSSKTEFALGERALVHHRHQDAVAHYRRSVRWYAPFNPYVQRSLDRLERIGKQAEKNHQPLDALDAYRAIRAGINSTRSTYTPHADYLARANKHIAHLMAQLPPPPIDANKSEAERERAFAKLYGDAPRPAVGWALLAIAGFFAWALATYRLLEKLDQATLKHTLATRWGLTWGLGVVAFVLGLRLA